MQERWHNPSPMRSASRGVLRLATRDGLHVDASKVRDESETHAAEVMLTIEFEGLTEAEQQRALAGFPGGKRFQLARTGS